MGVLAMSWYPGRPGTRGSEAGTERSSTPESCSTVECGSTSSCSEPEVMEGSGVACDPSSKSSREGMFAVVMGAVRGGRGKVNGEVRVFVFTSIQATAWLTRPQWRLSLPAHWSFPVLELSL